MLFWEHLIYVNNVYCPKTKDLIENYSSFPMYTVLMLITSNICYSEHAPLSHFWILTRMLGAS